jgi:hypothetical protein
MVVPDTGDGPLDDLSEGGSELLGVGVGVFCMRGLTWCEYCPCPWNGIGSSFGRP